MDVWAEISFTRQVSQQPASKCKYTPYVCRGRASDYEWSILTPQQPFYPPIRNNSRGRSISCWMCSLVRVAYSPSSSILFPYIPKCETPHLSIPIRSNASFGYCFHVLIRSTFRVSPVAPLLSEFNTLRRWRRWREGKSSRLETLKSLGIPICKEKKRKHLLSWFLIL